MLSTSIASTLVQPNAWMMLPFALLLLGIACGPVLCTSVWENHYRKISVGLGVISAGYYALVLEAPGRLAHVARDYVSFMVFIGSLFIVAGGIHLRTRGEATPWVNTLFLATGAVIANFLGTTGASMLLIRPWIRMNKYRFNAMHAAFFIFVVSNVGGCLTPIGDPPLFLGYLKGIPFFWITSRCLVPWAITVSAILLVFFIWDWRNFLRAPKAIRDKETAHESFKVEGWRNVVILSVVIISVILVPPTLPGVREVIMGAAAWMSYKFTSRRIHEANHFHLGPVKEVAWLFLGIFATMIPALDYVSANARAFGVTEPIHYYWLSGALSSVLDNAPTYLTFLSAAFGLKGLSIDDPAAVTLFLASHPDYVVAVSLGAVFFGAGTYIGNGPNLMVKAICDHAGVHTPNFFTYIIRFCLPVLLPICALVGWLLFAK